MIEEQRDGDGGALPPADPLAGSDSAPSNTRYGWPQVGTFILLAIAALHFARPLLLPLVLGVLLNLLLSPGVRALRRVGLPLPLGAGVVVLGVLMALGLGIWQLAE